VLRVPAGTVLFDAHQPCRGFPLLLEGAVRVAMNAPSGREILLYRVEPGQGCILSGGCLLGHADYAARGSAEGDVDARSASRRRSSTSCSSRTSRSGASSSACTASASPR
jgi:CRP-like cAMP-binding protein